MHFHKAQTETDIVERNRFQRTAVFEKCQLFTLKTLDYQKLIDANREFSFDHEKFGRSLFLTGPHQTFGEALNEWWAALSL